MTLCEVRDAGKLCKSRMTRHFFHETCVVCLRVVSQSNSLSFITLPFINVPIGFYVSPTGVRRYDYILFTIKHLRPRARYITTPTACLPLEIELEIGIESYCLIIYIQNTQPTVPFLMDCIDNQSSNHEDLQQTVSGIHG